jgi:hypothetical protein
MKTILVALALLAIALPAPAQTTATPSNKYAWTQPGQAAAVAQAATYDHYLDGATSTTVTLAGVACAPNTTTPANADCTASIPALTLGSHTTAISQVISGAESAKSNVITFQFVVVVQPQGLRIAKLLGFWRGGVLSSRGRSGLGRVQARNVSSASHGSGS